METDLEMALKEGLLEVLSEILRRDPALARQRQAWRHACHIGACQPIGYLAQARFNGLVTHNSSGEMTRLLIDAGAPVNGNPDDEETPLITAASYDAPDVAKALVESGANLEATGYAVKGGTALAHAVEFGAPEIVDLLFAAGSPVRSLREAAGIGHLKPELVRGADAEEQLYALRAAALCGRINVINELLAIGMAVNQLINGGTALHWAAWEAKVMSARYLVSRGADSMIRDPEHGGTPLDWARHRAKEFPHAHSSSHFEVIQALEEYAK